MSEHLVRFEQDSINGTHGRYGFNARIRVEIEIIGAAFNPNTTGAKDALYPDRAAAALAARLAKEVYDKLMPTVRVKDVYKREDVMAELLEARLA